MRTICVHGAGATGVDVALLVVSAVEGVMPQTREHVYVLELLGVRHLVVALTMRDLADDETAELAELDVMDFLGDTVFADAPVVPVSSRTGVGIEDVRLALDAAIDSFLADAASRPVRPGLAPRLPIDRCFTIKGSGTVVTGTLHDAPVAVGDELVSCPAACAAACARFRCMVILLGRCRTARGAQHRGRRCGRPSAWRGPLRVWC